MLLWPYVKTETFAPEPWHCDFSKRVHMGQRGRIAAVAHSIVPAISGWVETAKVLLQHGADMNELCKIRRRSSEHPVSTAIIHPSCCVRVGPMVHFVARARSGARNRPAVRAILHCTTMSRGRHSLSMLSVVDLLLEQGLDINACYGVKRATLLHHAAASRPVEMVQHLILRGASTPRLIEMGGHLSTGRNSKTTGRR